MFVAQIEKTPNPNALKFNLVDILPIQDTKSFLKQKDAINDPIASALFNIGSINSVYYSSRFITINKEDDADWDSLHTKVLDVIGSFSLADLENTDTEYINEEESHIPPFDGDILAKVNAVLDEHIRPALAGDGGGIDVVGLKGHTVQVVYQGACGGCPSAMMGTLDAIQRMIKTHVDDRLSVEPV